MGSTPSIRRDTKAAPPTPPVKKAGGPHVQRTDAEQSAMNEVMITRLDNFLDELAEGHRKAMDQVVTWLTGYGNLEAEIQKSVEALNPLLQKWSIEICFLLRMKEPRRFNELKENLPGIGSRTLSQRLKELEGQGIVSRKAFAEVPVRVEYSLTPKGKRMGDLFLPIIAHLRITGWREEIARRGVKA
ncbi:MAG: helix-turn-helix domain-containing protein [bacterium]